VTLFDVRDQCRASTRPLRPMPTLA
jgi:hypothetical protein